MPQPQNQSSGPHAAGATLDVETMPAWQRGAHRLANAEWFSTAIIAVIVLNAVTIGLETYPSIEDRLGGALTVVDRLFLAIFTVEILIRMAAVGFHPGRFFARGWNVFDFVAVGASYVPGLGANSTALRLVRLLRVARLLSVVPDVKVLLDGIRRAMRPAAGLLLLTVLLVYLYAVVGWSLFHEDDPERWGTVGEASLTLFTLLTLEGWNEILANLRDISPWAVAYVLSFILVGTFVVLNLVIGVVITSLDEAHQQHRRETEGDELADTIEALRNALDDLEHHIAVRAGGRDPASVTIDVP